MPIFFSADSPPTERRPEGGEGSCLSSRLPKHLRGVIAEATTVRHQRSALLLKNKGKTPKTTTTCTQKCCLGKCRGSMYCLWCSLRGLRFLSPPLRSTDEFAVFQPQLPLLCVAACPKHRTHYAFQQHSTCPTNSIPRRSQTKPLLGSLQDPPATWWRTSEHTIIVTTYNHNNWLT